MSDVAASRSWVTPGRVIGLSAGLALVSLGLVTLVDIARVAGELPSPLWHTLFGEGGPIEWAQWGLLGALAVSSAVLAERLRSRFFLLFAVTAVLLLIEDAGNVRHALAGYGQTLLGNRILGYPTSMFIEVPFFALLAAVPLYAVVRHGHEVWAFVAARRYLVTGYALYALAAIASGLRRLGHYEWLGRRANELLGGRIPLGPYEDTAVGYRLIVDFMIEESVELLAAACLVATVLACFEEVRRAADPSRPSPRGAR
jgi:hypothetical protein